jgi:hypothetical protein
MRWEGEGDMVPAGNEKPSPARSLSSGRAKRGPGGVALSLGEREKDARDFAGEGLDIA